MAARALRRILLPFALVLPLTLAGCFPLPILPPRDRDAASAPDGSSPTPDAQDDALPTALTFEAGETLPPGWIAQWGDGMMTDDDYAIASPDNGKGSWSYTYLPESCTVGMWQGRVADLGPAADDRELSDLLLAAYIPQSSTTVRASAFDDVLPYTVPGNRSMDARALASVPSAGRPSAYIAARGITSLQAGLVMSVQCPADAGADATQVAKVVEKNLAAILGPA